MKNTVVIRYDETTGKIIIDLNANEFIVESSPAVYVEPNACDKVIVINGVFKFKENNNTVDGVFKFKEVNN
jgi:hypothetical protein